MILPKELLDQLAYYEVKEVECTFGFITKIVLHFKQWWRPRKVIKFKWQYVKRESADITIWKPSVEDIQTRLWLQQYFKDK